VSDPSTIVLNTRLSDLADDVTKVQGVLERLALRGSHLDELKRLVTPRMGGKTITLPLRDAAEQANRLADAGQNDSTLAKMLDLEQVDVAKLVEHITEAQSRLREMGKTINAMTLVGLDQWRNALSQNLEVCKNVLDKVKGMKTCLADGTTAPQQVWMQLRELHYQSCQGLFADYVDLLSGMVLRDTHLDDEICAITDDFLAELASPRLVLPGRRSELPTVFKDLVKIGFPEWAVWDVPLAAHHAGAWRADLTLPDQPNWRDLLPDRSDDVRRCLFGDIYATRATGPAYACAMLLLHLDPASSAVLEPDAATDHERARVIIKALAFSEPPDEFTAFVRRIGADWDDAVEQNPAAGAASHDTAALDAFADLVRELLESRREPLYGATKWQAANKALAPLLRGDTDEPEQGQVKLLDLLNVAWTLRRAGTSPATVEDRVMSVWWTGGGREGTPPPSIHRSPSVRGE
jgi:hypothetical protein